MDIVGKKLTREEFTKYVESKDLGSVPPNGVVVHHTWRPTVASWQGERTINGLKRYYEKKGWSAGPHIFVAEDGIWLFTDMYKVGIHADSANATWEKNGRTGTGWPPRGAKVKAYTLGMEVVGNYDNKQWSGETKKNAIHVIKTLQKKLNIDNSGVTFHRDYKPSKTCPGRGITKPWLWNELQDKPEEKPQGHEPSPWAEEAWKKATQKGVLSGEYPQEPLTREQLAVILDRLNLLNN